MTEYFPDLSVEFHFSFGIEYRNQVTRFANGRRQARPLVEQGLRHLQGRIPTITWDTSEAVRAFVDAQRGNLFPFFIYYHARQQFTAFPEALTVGTQTTYILPFLFDGAAFGEVRVDGTLKTLTTDYTITEEPGGYGLGGEALLNFVEVQTVGKLVTIDVLGRERILVELVDGVLSVEHPNRVPQERPYPADFYGLNVVEYPMRRVTALG